MFSDAPILTVTVHDEDESNKFHYKVIESSGFGADKFTMVRNNDGTGSLKVVQSLDYEDQLQRAGFRFRIQVNDKVSTRGYNISWGLRSVAGLVIQANGRRELEDGLRPGSPGGVLSDNPSVRTSSLVTLVL